MDTLTAPASVIIVSGTGTEIGKTIVTAAVAAALSRAGQRVAVVKPVQTGLAEGEPGDVDEVRRLAGDRIDTHELARLPEPLAPDVAARRMGVTLPPVGDHASYIADLATSGRYDVVLVEGAGGLLVHLDSAGGTIADLASSLRLAGIRAGVIVVVAEVLGTLNHTALTLEALAHRDLDLVGVVLGSVSADPDLAALTNQSELATLAGGELLGAIPSNAGRLDPVVFQQNSVNWLRL